MTEKQGVKREYGKALPDGKICQGHPRMAQYTKGCGQKSLPGSVAPGTRAQLSASLFSSLFRQLLLMDNYLLLLLHLFLFHYTASFLLFPCLRLALSLQISCFLSIWAILLSSPASSSHPFPYFCYLFLLSLFVTPFPFLPAHHRWRRHSPSLPLKARPWSGIRNPSSLLDRELRRLGFGTSVLLTAGTENRCHFRCQLQADEQQLPGGTDLLHGSCWADTQCCSVTGVGLLAVLSHQRGSDLLQDWSPHHLKEPSLGL